MWKNVKARQYMGRYVKMLWTDPNEIPSMLTTSRIEIFMTSKGSSFTGSTFSSLLLVDIRFTFWASSTVVTPLFNLENHLKTCVLPIFCSPKATFNILEVYMTFFTSKFTAKPDADVLFFQVRRLLGTQKSQHNNTLALKKSLFSSHTQYSPIPGRKWLNTLLIYISKSLHQL